MCGALPTDMTTPTRHPKSPLSAVKTLAAVPSPARIASGISRGAQDAARASVSFVKDHPVATAGALAGVALVAGAVAHRAIQREPTLAEVFRKTATRRVARFSKALASGSKRGIDAAARAVSKSLK
jgi:hypothetical protein